jgi:hypothetical protein
MRAIFEVGERVSQGDGVMTKAEFISAEMGTRVTAHAMHVGDRINTMNLEVKFFRRSRSRSGSTRPASLFFFAMASRC